MTIFYAPEIADELADARDGYNAEQRVWVRSFFEWPMWHLKSWSNFPKNTKKFTGLIAALCSAASHTVFIMLSVKLASQFTGCSIHLAIQEL